MAGSPALEDRLSELEFRLDAFEYAIEECVPTLVGALVLNLARKGVLDLGTLEADLRRDVLEDPGLSDSTDAMLSTLASLVACYRRDGNAANTARYAPIYELTKRG